MTTPLPPQPPPRWSARFQSAARWLHIYVSMVSFVILAFFAFTGITLNHQDWFASHKPTQTQSKGSLSPTWVGKPGDEDSVHKLEIVEQLRKTHTTRGQLTEFRIDDDQCTVSFRGPAYSADAFINRKDGTYEFQETKMGTIALINDLHKGRDSGIVWSWVIDISAVLMLLLSITGLMLLFFLKRRRLSGLIALILGGLLTWAIYLLYVP